MIIVVNCIVSNNKIVHYTCTHIHYKYNSIIVKIKITHISLPFVLSFMYGFTLHVHEHLLQPF